MQAKTRFVFVALLVAGCGDSHTTSSQPLPTFGLDGVVTFNNVPQAGARVRVALGVATQVARVTTDSQGRFTIPGLRGGVVLEAWKPGFFPTFSNNLTAFDPLGVNLKLLVGRAIAVGDTVRGSLSPNPQSCFDDSCEIFMLTPSVSGAIEISVMWTDPVDLRLSVATLESDSSAPPAPRGLLTIRATVTAGVTYEIRVATALSCEGFELAMKPGLP